MSNTQFNYVYYGMETDSNEVRSFTEHIIKTNITAEENGRKKSPICIWGTHGIGKTEMVQQIATDLNYKWAYIAPA